MFTGIIQACGILKGRLQKSSGARLTIQCSSLFPSFGESVAVDGTCLTIAQLKNDCFEVDASEETLRRTTLGALSLGSSLNLERSLQLHDRLGGHLVLGHIDGTAPLVQRIPKGDSFQLGFSYPKEWNSMLAIKGCITINGVSLTLTNIELNRFEVVIIPTTCHLTNLHRLKIGQKVNIELDVMARYVARWLEHNTLLQSLSKTGYLNQKIRGTSLKTDPILTQEDE
ncbi:riboflavin synthase [Pajaroellobacter abortibovis]|uniref:Riboflavin synthase n=1 Tax=Pajaroellobacter abortibovis TaxID=1882918 RepID=A0A1L6MVK1_9BACT|nr:riboflavin synthase [Pajaroellobacter abortibovis]APR99531.1 riboflavin synthase subunit alpha [Pajaroellobacter abortibovis]